MEQRNSGNKPTSDSARTKWIVTAVAVAVIVGLPGIFLLIIGGILYAAYQKQKKQEGEAQDDPLAPRDQGTEAGNPFDLLTRQRPPASRPGQGVPLRAPEQGDAARRAPFPGKKPAAGIPALLLPPEEREHAEELRDLLHAGIIDQAEYNDRMREVKTGSSR